MTMRAETALLLIGFASLNIGFVSTAAGADRPTVRYAPGHRLADAAGYVLELGSEGEADIFGGDRLNPPLMPGWPVTIQKAPPLEGAVLVQADADPEPEILFSTQKTVHLMNYDGTELTGWPLTVAAGSRLAGGPAFGDLDGDGEGEVVVCNDNWPNGSTGRIYAYHTDGTDVSGFPAFTNGDHSRSPTVVDLNDDGAAEIIVGERDYPIGRVYVFDGSGTLLPGWPVELDHVPAASAGAADLDGDGMKEIVYQSYSSLYGFNYDGSEVFTFTPPNGDVYSYSAPVFADVDGDDLPEIAVGTHVLSGTNHVYLHDGDGTVMSGWPRAVGYWVYAPPTFADLDGDEDLEIVVGDQVLSGSPTDRVYAWHHDGTTVSGFPIGPVWAINAQVAVADIDGDGDPELIWDDNTTDADGEGKLLGYHHDGSPIAGWPIITDGTTFFNTVCLADFDADGDLELLGESGTTSAPYECNAYLWDLPDATDPALVQMAMFQYGPGRDGLFGGGVGAPCPADFDGDGAVSVFDLLELLANWGPCLGCPYDFDDNGAVDVFDLLMLLDAWGPCP
jgi:hypothetical protein